MCPEKKKVQCSHFIYDVKKPYLHNTFKFLNMLQLFVENHSIKTETSDPDFIFKILSQIQIFLSGFQFNFIACLQRETKKKQE